jgi:two-component system nitrogen regulation response regulator GlnG
MVRSGQFRGDLFYRLNGYTIDLPPLRQREGDLIYLLEHFRIQANQELGKSVSRFSPEAVEMLSRYDWPGNVREFQSVVRRAVLQTTGQVVIPDFLPKFGEAGDAREPAPLSRPVSTFKSEIARLVQQKIQSGESGLYDDLIARVERELIAQVLQVTNGNQVDAAALLGITRTTLRTKIRKLGICISRSVATSEPAPADALPALTPQRKSGQ